MPASAFDATRPPSADRIADCVHCGFCLPTCPTYSLWGEEMDSPRGRIVLMRAGLEEGSELSRTMVTHIDRCLGCMACVTACPSGVKYDRLIEDQRAELERNKPRTPGDRLFRAMLFALFPYPARLRFLLFFQCLFKQRGSFSVAQQRRIGADAAIAGDLVMFDTLSGSDHRRILYLFFHFIIFYDFTAFFEQAFHTFAFRTFGIFSNAV